MTPGLPPAHRSTTPGRPLLRAGTAQSTREQHEHRAPRDMQALIAAVLAGVTVHLLSIAVSGSLLGARFSVLSIGFGPALLDLGRLRIALLPLGGYVGFDDLQQPGEQGAKPPSTLDRLPLAQRLAVALSGCAVLVLLACACLGLEGLRAFAAGPGQILWGALTPLGDGPRLLAQADSELRTASPVQVLGLVAAKLAAFNILPLPMCNGGAALAMIGRHLGLARWWPRRADHAWGMFYLLGALSWLMSLLIYRMEA
ncbi:MAG: hypothetical protein EPO01_20780 [Aquabacterium sp.]|nr:MAG: hypothetical protein EPO01_20780 [Aquabacterium sp.]